MTTYLFRITYTGTTYSIFGNSDLPLRDFLYIIYFRMVMPAYTICSVLARTYKCYTFMQARYIPRFQICDQQQHILILSKLLHYILAIFSSRSHNKQFLSSCISEAASFLGLYLLKRIFNFSFLKRLIWMNFKLFYLKKWEQYSWNCTLWGGLVDLITVISRRELEGMGSSSFLLSHWMMKVCRTAMCNFLGKRVW